MLVYLRVSHFLQVFFTSKTVVGLWISEPSTVSCHVMTNLRLTAMRVSRHVFSHNMLGMAGFIGKKRVGPGNEIRLGILGQR